MTGVATNVCVESTARHAVFLDYRLVFMADATARFDNARRHDGKVAVDMKLFDKIEKATNLLDY